MSMTHHKLLEEKSLTKPLGDIGSIKQSLSTWVIAIKLSRIHAQRVEQRFHSKPGLAIGFA